MFRYLVLVAAAAGLSACATQYTQEGLIGGFDVKDLGQDVYRVSFNGNGYTSRETAQTYWLYRAAEFAVQQGYTGFEILSDISFVMRATPEDGSSSAPGAIAAAPESIPASPNEVANSSATLSKAQNEVGGESGDRVRLAHAAPVFIYTGGNVATPHIEADVHFIRRPVVPAPPKVFNASVLKAALDPIVKAEKCNFGNICPHVHVYLLPKGKLQ